jgi:hypothetical protein
MEFGRIKRENRKIGLNDVVTCNVDWFGMNENEVRRECCEFNWWNEWMMNWFDLIWMNVFVL